MLSDYAFPLVMSSMLVNEYLYFCGDFWFKCCTMEFVLSYLRSTMLFYSHTLDGIQTDSCLFVCFVALRPKSTAMVMAGRSVNLTTLFPGQA